MNRLLILGVFALACVPSAFSEGRRMSNNEHADRTLLVIAAPPADSDYYRDVYRAILDFDIAYAKQAMNRSNVVVLGDAAAMKVFRQALPEDILLPVPMRDIWIRDFTTVMPQRPVQFRYAAAAQGGSQDDADWVQDGFNRWAKRLGLKFQRTSYILDGGNVVDNGHDKAIVSDRFLTDNKVDMEKAKAILRQQLGARQVAIVPADDDKLAHADGMVMFVAANTVVVNRYEGEYRKRLLNVLRNAFADVRIMELPTVFDDREWDPKFNSAHGVYTNSVVTEQQIYMPIYGLPGDAAAVAKVKACTDKEVITVDARHIGQMGGSVRCLTWQVRGENARKLIQAAREQ